LGGIIYKPLGTIASRNSGTAITAATMKNLHSEGASIRVFAGGNTIADVNEGDIPDKNVIHVPSIIVKSRGHIGFDYYDKPFSHKNELWSYSISDREVNQKFVYYYLTTQVTALQTLAKSKSVKLPQLSISDTDILKIPVPPLPIQERIVAILDKFDALVNDISVGLPAEIATRRQQYEYYRNKLLTFEEVS
jgi:type I restriction enzyme S subunit